MVGSGGGGIAAHLQYIQEDAVDSGGQVTPDVVKKTKCTHV